MRLTDLKLQDIEAELARRRLYEFVRQAWSVIEPAPFVPGWHLEAICEHLETVTRGEIRNLLINGAAHREVMPLVTHDTSRYANNRAEVSHQPTRQRERQMRRFKSPNQAQRFLSFHGLIQNLFRLSRHWLRSDHHRMLRSRSFATWQEITAA